VETHENLTVFDALGSSPNKGYSNWCDTTVTLWGLVHVLAAYALTLVLNYGNTFHWVGHFENIAVRKIMFIYWTNRRRVFGHFTNMDVQRYKFLMYDNSVLAV
jgi:hypothetical protein